MKKCYVLNHSFNGTTYTKLEVFQVGEEAKLLNRVQEIRPDSLKYHEYRGDFSKFIDLGPKAFLPNDPYQSILLAGVRVFLATINS